MLPLGGRIPPGGASPSIIGRFEGPVPSGVRRLLPRLALTDMRLEAMPFPSMMARATYKL